MTIRREDFSSTNEYALAKAAEAMIEAQTRQLIDHIEKSVNFCADGIPKFYEQLQNESDTATAVLIFSYIDSLLRDALLQVLNPDIPGGNKALVDSFGPLESANNRIKMAYALYWIDKSIFRNLECMRKIRNHCAHHPFASNLNQDPVISLIGQMDNVEKRMIDLIQEDFRDYNNLSDREKYICRCILTANGMILQILSAPFALRMGLPPFHVLSKGYKYFPEPIKRAHEKSVEAMYVVAGSKGFEDRTRD